MSPRSPASVAAEPGKSLAEPGKSLAESGKWLAKNGKWLAKDGKWLAEDGKQLAEPGKRMVGSHQLSLRRPVTALPSRVRHSPGPTSVVAGGGRWLAKQGQ